MNKKIALLFGSTGLVGGHVLTELIKSEAYSSVRIFVRKHSGVSHPGTEEIVTDFSDLSAISKQFAGDDVFICTGTTLRKAGSVENFVRVDRDLPVGIATICKSNGASGIAVVSSVGANPSSLNYYLRAKGEMEQSITGLNFDKTVIARPSLLLGNRKESRPAESIGKFFMKAGAFLIPGKYKRYRPIHAENVAKAIVAAITGDLPGGVYESDELQRIAK